MISLIAIGILGALVISCNAAPQGEEVEFGPPITFSDGPNTQIHGGEDASPGEFPYQVQLLRGPNLQIYCSGTIISDRWILTAAHCMSNRTFRVLAGTIDNRERGKNATIVEAELILNHPKYKYVPRPFFIIHDIALMKLKSPLQFNDKIKPAKLAQKGHQSSAKILVSGWGQTKTEQFPRILKKVELDFMNDKDCQEAYKPKGYKVDETMICGGDKGGKKSGCYGDSGGPWFDKPNNVLVGVVSWGASSCSHPVEPNVSTEVSYYLDWIKEVTGLTFE